MKPQTPEFLTKARAIFSRAAFAGDLGIRLKDLGPGWCESALGERLRCRATVLRQGKTLIVAESEVFAERDGNRKLVSKATVTLALVPAAAR